jgi:hypothetical protein
MRVINTSTTYSIGNITYLLFQPLFDPPLRPSS